MTLTSRPPDDLRYFRNRAEHCRRAAREATDPSARIAHQQLAAFYEARLALAEAVAAAHADQAEIAAAQ